HLLFLKLSGTVSPSFFIIFYIFFSISSLKIHNNMIDLILSYEGECLMELEKKQVTTTKRIVGLDGSRGLSILLVILYHFFPRVVKGGYLGVPLLFILSGYLLSSLDTKKWNK